MRKSAACDKICIEKIVKNIDRIKTAYAHFGIKAPVDLMNCDLAQLAVTQAITNIYEAKKLFRQETLNNIKEFDMIRISATRNIASHDYDSVNFNIIYDISVKLMSKQIKEVLWNAYKRL